MSVLPPFRAKTESVEMPQQQLDSYNVLVIDDALMIRNLVHTVLLELGFKNVDMANGGKQALDLIRRKKYDFVITDWSMEDVDGISIVKTLRATQQAPLSIIMLTANTEVAHVKTAIKAGVDAYLIKPFSAEHLAKRIIEIIENPRAFIISPKYRGPDRRRANKPPPDGVEKRRKKK